MIMASGLTAGRMAWPYGGTQDAEPGQRVGQDLFPLTERKPHLELPGIGVVVEHDTGNRHDTSRVRELAAEFQAAHLAKSPDVRGDEVGARRAVHLEARRGQPVAHQVTPAQDAAGDRSVV